MTGEAREAADGDAAWPVDLRGVTETVTTTLGPNGRWNAAALGVRAPARSDGSALVEGSPTGEGSSMDEGPAARDGSAPGDGSTGDDARATARTWGRTRTKANFERRGEGYVQFVTDPLVFVEAALGVDEHDDPVLDAANAWARVEVERRDDGESDGIEWVEWGLRPVEAGVERRTVPTINRGFGAVVEATVWASRLDVEGYDRETLRERLGFLEDVTRTAGGQRDRGAFDRLRELSDY
jgi:hypothetical protein